MNRPIHRPDQHAITGCGQVLGPEVQVQRPLDHLVVVGRGGVEAASSRDARASSWTRPPGCRGGVEKPAVVDFRPRASRVGARTTRPASRRAQCRMRWTAGSGGGRPRAHVREKAHDDSGAGVVARPYREGCPRVQANDHPGQPAAVNRNRAIQNGCPRFQQTGCPQEGFWGPAWAGAVIPWEPPSRFVQSAAFALVVNVMGNYALIGQPERLEIGTVEPAAAHQGTEPFRLLFGDPLPF